MQSGCHRRLVHKTTHICAVMGGFQKVWMQMQMWILNFDLRKVRMRMWNMGIIRSYSVVYTLVNNRRKVTILI